MKVFKEFNVKKRSCTAKKWSKAFHLALPAIEVKGILFIALAQHDQLIADVLEDKLLKKLLCGVGGQVKHLVYHQVVDNYK